MLQWLQPTGAVCCDGEVLLCATGCILGDLGTEPYDVKCVRTAGGYTATCSNSCGSGDHRLSDNDSRRLLLIT
jgi:hypothetical protein